ncbi:hypothetical protein ADUPG1_013065 [Aduncisulcus paluster]|uniref:Centrosomin N-terminal motif 1 domain-containing protein n=1 Tax=Aduncisulcus paluster TaxID=2918883 RepID=A0ABQ5K599_9EUKA|nr:hypothetical protein ADUPG1_013065 [Aduncisulcus paluster]
MLRSPTIGGNSLFRGESSEVRWTKTPRMSRFSGTMTTKPVGVIESFKDLQEKISKLERENFNLRLQLFQVQDALAQKEGKSVDDISRRLEKQRMASSVALELDKKDQILAKSQIDIREYFAREENLMFQLQQLQEEIELSKSTLIDLSEEVKQLEVENKTLKQEVIEKDAIIQEKTRDITIKTSKEEILQADIESLQKESKKYREEMEESIQQMTLVTESMESLEKRYHTLEEERGRMEAVLKERQHLCAVAVEEKDKLKRIATSYKRKIEELGENLKLVVKDQKESVESATAWKNRVSEIISAVVKVAKEKKTNPCCFEFSSKLFQVVSVFVNDDLC